MRTLINTPKVSATLYRLADWLKGRPEPVKPSATTSASPFQSKVVPLRPSTKGALPLPTATQAPLAQRTLRVLRVVDGQGRASGGRMVISGRMADVCAELDRLAGKEAAAA
jgi:hypothetical protein